MTHQMKAKKDEGKKLMTMKSSCHKIRITSFIKLRINLTNLLEVISEMLKTSINI